MYSNSGISISCVERIERILQILCLALLCDVDVNISIWDADDDLTLGFVVVYLLKGSPYSRQRSNAFLQIEDQIIM